ncbi:MAG: ABC transporter permease [Spirochaetales bacterium]|nr:ABC transporter permease [Spirochaetales bacterium]MBP7263906.1 ABC transporter permease [Spirochaetia bacterium]
MSPILTVARRELRAYFNSALAYAFIVSFLVVCGVFFFFVNGFFAANQASMRLWFGLMPIVLSVLLPALTMRLWADEKRQGTYELLRTLPFSETQLVLGKHLAVFGLIGITALASLPVPALCSLFGRFDTGVIASSYIGLVLLASASASVGQLVSALSKNQITAFLVSVLVLLALNLTHVVTTWAALPSWLAAMFNWLSLGYHFTSFLRGVLDTRDVAYFVFLTAAGLYLAVKELRFAAWR